MNRSFGLGRGSSVSERQKIHNDLELNGGLMAGCDGAGASVHKQDEGTGQTKMQAVEANLLSGVEE